MNLKNIKKIHTGDLASTFNSKNQIQRHPILKKGVDLNLYF